jgi:hypothetical protein
MLSSLRTTIPAAIVAVALTVGLVKMLAALAGYGNIPLLNRSVTTLLCIGWGVALVGIVRRLQEIWHDSIAVLTAAQPDERQMAKAYEASLAAIAQALASEAGVTRKKRRYRLNLYPDSVTGVEIVTWLVRHQRGTRLEATHLAEDLQKRGYLRSVTDQPFQDDESLYQLAPEDEAAPAIAPEDPPTPPLESSESLEFQPPGN